MDKIKQHILLKKGAEANLYLANWHGKKVVIKIRAQKKYRAEVLDSQIRSCRTIHEAQLLHQTKIFGVTTPLVYMVNIPEATIVMEYINGIQVKQYINKASKEECKKVCLQIGELVGKLHKENFIHGDLTTSNMILNKHGTVFLVDFGLGEKSAEIEAKGVDLHLLKRTLQSTHFAFWEACFNEVLTGYSLILGDKISEKIYEKIREIEKRGRYVEERKQNL
ncbi:MAG: Kae1-associated serine/threonine protein kinase [Nitrososphaerota archaeon]|jgi:TP53 regulating kinase-like protein|nr:Kae1-associated serine/threonine protein kinase [Nitrososphaerota archaeon]